MKKLSSFAGYVVILVCCGMFTVAAQAGSYSNTGSTGTTGGQGGSYNMGASSGAYQMDPSTFSFNTQGAQGAQLAENTAEPAATTGDMNTGSQNLNTTAFKDSIKARLNTAKEQVDAMDKNTSSLSPSDRDTMKIKTTQLRGKIDSVKKMLGNLKSNASPANRQQIEDATTDLENMIKGTPATQRVQ